MKHLVKYLKTLNWKIIVPIIIIGFFSLLNLFSISHSLNLSLFLFKKQLVLYLLGFLLFLVLSRFNWSALKNSPFPIIAFYLVSLFILILPIVFHQQIRGTHSWLKIGFFDFQPVETIKIALILVLAKYFSSRHIEMYQFKHLIISGGYLVIPLTLVLIQPDLGSAIILITIWIGIIIFSGIKTKHFIILLLLAIIISLVGWLHFLKDYQKQRIISFIHPQEKINSQNYNLHQSLIAIGSGGLTGKGILYGSQNQLGFLPERQSDFALAAFAEEWGLSGCLILLLSYLYLFSQLIKNSLEMNNNFSRLYLIGFCLCLFIQTVINIGVNLGLLPVTGLPLPFFSAGGSNLLANFTMLGLAEGIIRHNR